MRSFICALLLTASITPGAQIPTPQRTIEEPGNIRLPSGKMQRDEILKADHQKNLEDASELMKLTEELKIDIEKGEGQVLSIAALKKVDQIEKLAKRIRGRIKK